MEIRRRDFLEGTWAPFLLHAATLRFRYPCAPPAVAHGLQCVLHAGPAKASETDPAIQTILASVGTLRRTRGRNSWKTSDAGSIHIQ